jgi:hypothetical protein
MPTIDGASLSGLLSSPLALIAGALAALIVVLLVVAFRRTGAARGLLLPIAAVVLFGLGLMAVLDRMTEGERAAERRSLAQRNAELTAQALAPGSTLACLDGAAGDAVENACEKTVFAGPQSAAAAVAYMAARLTLLADGVGFARHGNPDFAASLAGLRRAIELDRYGIAAHVLAVRDGCIAERCGAFALLDNTDVLKSNLKAQVFDQYVSRYAADWNKAEPKTAPMAEKQPPASVPLASASEAPAKTPLSDKYDFPSADSIPAVSIMNAEPPLPKGATDAQAAGEPVPPKRPQAQAASPVPR